jgi:type IV pilus assembly protein PilN
MIRINLLARKKKAVRAKLDKDMFVAVIAMLFLVVILGFVHWQMLSKTAETSRQITATQKEIAFYKAQIEEAKKAKEEQKVLQEKLDVIKSLQQQRSSAARVMDEISVLKPEKVQLESLRKDGSKVGIQGIALDDETVANFMTNLRRSKLFKTVDLIISEQIELSKIKLKKFTLSCEIVPM